MVTQNSPKIISILTSVTSPTRSDQQRSSYSGDDCVPGTMRSWHDRDNRTYRIRDESADGIDERPQKPDYGSDDELCELQYPSAPDG